MLQKDNQYLEERGFLIIRSLCKYMETDIIFPLLSEIIQVLWMDDWMNDFLLQ